jgi:hypothetical protein
LHRTFFTIASHLSSHQISIIFIQQPTLLTHLFWSKSGRARPLAPIIPRVSPHHINPFLNPQTNNEHAHEEVGMVAGRVYCSSINNLLFAVVAA